MPANIHSIEALKEAMAALAKFAEEAGALLANVDSDVARMGQWLTHERPAHWKTQVRRREELVQAARQEISRKVLAAAPNPASTVLERRALARAQEKLAEAQKRQQSTRRWVGVWDKESLMARGSISQLAEFVRADIPRAIAKIDRMMVQVEGYLSIKLSESDLPAGTATGTEGSGPSMARPLDEPLPEEPIQNYAHLRPLALEARSRAKPPRDAIEWGTLALESLSERAQSEIAGLATAGRPVDPGLTLVIADNALSRAAIWAHRVEPEDETDSGWYFGPLDSPGSTGACWRGTIREALAARPDLQPLLGAAVGTLAILGPEGPMAIIDSQGRNVWLAER